jgi:lipoprotein NlpI
MVLNRRLMHVIFTVERCKAALEDALRNVLDDNNDDDDLIHLYTQYSTMEKDDTVEVCKEKYKKSVEQYQAFLSKQPWKLLAWVLKLPTEESIS